MVSLWWAAADADQLQARRQAELKSHADASLLAMRAQLQDCETLIRSFQAVFATLPVVDHGSFERVYERLQPRVRFPSLQAIAYAPRSEAGGQARYVTALVAPMAGNERVVGLDVGSQPANLRAVERSRDFDRVVLSSPFRLLQFRDADARVDGITMRVPVYSRGTIPRTMAERRTRLAGSLAVSFRVSDLIDAALQGGARDSLHTRITDISGSAPVGGAPTKTAPIGTAPIGTAPIETASGREGIFLFDSHPGRKVARTEIVRRELRFGDRVWRMEMSPAGPLAAAQPVSKSPFWAGLLASVLLAGLVHSSITMRRRARRLAEQMSQRFRDSEERFRALNELLPALVLLARVQDHRIVYANQAARTRLGEAVGMQVLPHLFDDPALRGRIEAGHDCCGTIEARLHTSRGSRFWASVSISRVIVDDHAHLLMVAADISEQRELTELLTYQASHDALTELYNRREFERRVEQARAALAQGGAPGALLYIDLDQFKLINDTSGHLAGDHLLTELAGIMREQLRGDDVLARLGGDEFGILATHVKDRHGAQLVADRLRERIDGYDFVWENRNYAISASIGVVMLDDPSVTLKDLFAHADTACYQAKENGRNRVQFFSAHDDDTTRRHSEMEWATRLRAAVAEQRLLLHYQEVWPLAGEADGARVELLVRLREQDGTLVPPGAFIPAAERYGLMPMIDRWVIETALSHFDELHPSGAALQLATINLSGHSLEEDALADHIIERMRRHRVDPSRVCFEVTETVAVRNVARVSRFIQRLRAAGCRIALDDFGAGMSSFGYLKSLPVDMIKIDGGFVRDLTTDPMSQAIVRAVTDIGHQRGLTVVAEWVATPEIAAMLRRFGVDFAQGYALHVPEAVAFQRVAVQDGAAQGRAGVHGVAADPLVALRARRRASRGARQG
ncbi:EAL domain-containing protein [Lysobacter solisilvae]|uniref:EAL domain-containing protein n=2 Tax=Agrilutibacter solisilvae TaxID=2763317 RepID=A0A975ATH5_9GAMM|nr:EAL domain-containing protein [Lysobacter solisilvae]